MTVHLDAGQTFSFDYRFDSTNDNESATNNAFIFLDSFYFPLTNPQFTGGDTGWQTYTAPLFNLAGDYTIGFGVESELNDVRSALYIDHIMTH